MTRILSNREHDASDSQEASLSPAEDEATSAAPRTAERPLTRRGDDQASQYYLGLSHQLATMTGVGASDTTVAIGLTSATRYEGVTSVAVNLAAAASQDLNGRVLLIDANLEHPHAAEVAGAVQGNGLSDLLLKSAALSDCVQPSSISNLDVLPAGSSQASRQFVAGTDRVRSILQEMSHDYRMIIVDLPPANELTACLPIACCLDGVVLVVEAERTRNKTVARAKQQLVQSGANVLGVVFNKRREYVPGWLYKRV